MILALNTAQAIHELALLKGDRLLAERRWTNAKEDVEKLVPLLQELLDETGSTRSDLTDLLVVRGPGSFTSVRVGVAFMNALAEGLRTSGQAVRLYELDTFELMSLKAATTDPLLVVLHAGGLDIGLTVHAHKFQVGPLATLLADHPHDPSTKVAAELPETLSDELHSIAQEKGWQILEEHELQTLGEALATSGLTALHETDTATPLYLKNANITVSSDPWKRAK